MKLSIQKKANDYAIFNLALVPDESVMPASFSFQNNKCHTNSVAAFRSGRADKVWLSLCSNGDYAFVHFINSKDGKYFDETLHEHDHPWKHYIIRQVADSEMGEIGELLNITQRSLLNMLASPIEKFMHAIGLKEGV